MILYPHTFGRVSMIYKKELFGFACNMDWIISSSSVERLLTPDSGWAERQMADYKKIT